MFIILLLVILIILYFIKNDSKDYFNVNKSTCKSSGYYDGREQQYPYPYNPQVPTPMSNYIQKTNKINQLNQYKKDLSVALGPTPTIHCPRLKDKENCNKYGCNWFGDMCSSTYPTQY